MAIAIKLMLIVTTFDLYVCIIMISSLKVRSLDQIQLKKNKHGPIMVKIQIERQVHDSSIHKFTRVATLFLPQAKAPCAVHQDMGFSHITVALCNIYIT